MKTIVFINLYPEMGGGEYALYNLLKRIDRNRIRPVMLFNQPGPFIDKVGKLGVETVILRYHNVMLSKLVYPHHFWHLIQSSRLMYRYIQQNKPDVIHCSDVLALLYIAYAVLRFHIPVVYNVIFFYEWQRMILFNVLALFLVKRIVTNSQAVKNDLLRRTVFLSRKIDTVYQGVDTELFRPSRDGDVNVLRKELKLDPKVKLVGMVGRYDPSKGHKVFLHAASHVLKKRSDVKFVLIGGVLFGDVFPFFRRYYDDVLNYHRELRLEEKVIFLPHRGDMPEVMRSLDVFVLPSLNEGFGLVILEALASNVPIVASRTIGAMEVVGDTEGVFAAEPGDPMSFAEKIDQALEYVQNKLYHTFNSAKLSQLTWAEYSRKMEQLYETVVKR
ncbi:MAG: glycosyltransferase family 4 protein [Ignavibacteriae bacterium]|nr:glycosyltransferase family 4 protein [Ignavibacteriota bacterium]